jgi:hypothetical protein
MNNDMKSNPSSQNDPLNYFRGFPPLAGVCSFYEAERVGYSVDEAVTYFKRFHWAMRRIWHILISRIASERVYELKMGYSYHAHLLAEQIADLRSRVGEMREPPLGLDVCPDATLDVFFDEILCASTTLETVTGLYAVALPTLCDDLRHHIQTTNPLVDAPSIRLLKHAADDLHGIITWGRQTIEAVAASSPNESLTAITSDFASYLAAAGGIAGRTKRKGEISRRRSACSFSYDLVPKRDERFSDPFNSAVNAEAMIHGDYPDRIKALMLLYKRLREVDVPEMMASILMQTPGKPWGYYRDMTRQLWDEARHAIMGQVGFRQLGLDWSKIPIRHAWAYELNTILTAQERHGVLYFIERGLMPKAGKQHEWEVAQRAENHLLATFQDFDWADEVLHARIGRNWYVKEFATPAEAIDFGDKAWTSIFTKRQDYAANGLTAHRNWWPDFYRHACDVLGLEFDPQIAAYEENDLETRADLKKMATSA